MTAAIHKWDPIPIARFVSQYKDPKKPYSDAIWYGSDANEFESRLHNVVELAIAFDYEKPYGGSARYIVEIDRRYSSGWYRTIRDEVSFYPEDDARKVFTKPYQISFDVPLFAFRKHAYTFRISCSIEGPGSIGTSLGYWEEQEPREFTVTFKKPSAKIVEERVRLIRQNLDDVMKLSKHGK